MAQDNFYTQCNRIIKLKDLCVLATVTSVTGSTPQQPGSSALFSLNKVLAGTVGGGPTELEVSQLAANAIRTKKSGYFSFNLNHEISDNQGPICGGGMNILVDANPEIHLSVFESLTQSLKNRIPGVLLTIFTQSEKDSRIWREWLTTENQDEISSQLASFLKQEVSKMLNNPVCGDFREIYLSKSGNAEKEIAFLETITPPPQLIIAGAGHVGKAVTHLGNWLGYEVVVWDDRPEFASAKNLPEAHHVFSGDISQLKNNLAIGKNTFVVIVTRGHNNDAEVLKEFINEDVAYLGMMGSKRKVAQVRQLFFENGWATEEQWNKVFTPIGIEISSKTVNEIAVSIAAQLIEVRNGRR